MATEFAVAFYQALTTGQKAAKPHHPRRLQDRPGVRPGRRASPGRRAGGEFRDLVADAPPSGISSTMRDSPGKSSIVRGPSTSGAGASSRTIPFSPCPTSPTSSAGRSSPIATWRISAARTPGSSSAEVEPFARCTTCSSVPSDSAGSRLILYYGQTGVGKTSVLAAGLLPRLETQFQTIYAREPPRRGCSGRSGSLWLPAPTRSTLERPGWPSSARPVARS